MPFCVTLIPAGQLSFLMDVSPLREGLSLGFVLVGPADPLGEIQVFQDGQSPGHRQQARLGVTDLLLVAYA